MSFLKNENVFCYQIKQKQLLSCKLRLDPTDKITSFDPDDCSCYTKTVCEGL